ncbi:nuclear transport factor 2 family protein [Shewanella sp. SR44-3]|uniref:nuclear transport factor 2 family protein n=1 Tax=unclassified Shewanella TaxID=196818 RepID=UPI0015FAF61B|nr:nuclear transport factor 2 family protein [Shewanella sp. SR44-3]MBB1268153.1 nuclear transport factor 2 family protein [Shewanella sp. SR44-3]
MTSLLHRLGFIAVIVTSAIAFEAQAQDAGNQDQNTNKQLATNGLSQTDKIQVDTLLDNLHQSASDADWDSYFSSYHHDAVFLGTDATERWGMQQFKQYAQASKGWSYQLKSRKLIKINDLIVFDEALHSPSYGETRGTGALVHTQHGWKVAQYHLTFPIPNDKAKQITQLLAKP